MRVRALSISSLLLLPLAVLAPPGVSFAQATSPGQAPAPDIGGATAAHAVPSVVVTATRFAVEADQVGQSVTVLTAADLRLDQETDVANILARTPGVTLARNGGPGETASLFIRGAESAQTVVLIDGVKVNDPTDPSAGYDFSNLGVGDIARIEVLRGPQSTLYGSEAIGGVVNVVTADAVKPLEGEARVEGGSYGTGYVSGAIGGKEPLYDWRIGAYYEATDSVPAFDEKFGGHVARGFDTSGLSARFRYDITPILQVDQRVYFTASRNEFDGYDTPSGNFGDDAEFGRTQQLVDYTGLNLSLFDGRLKNRLGIEYTGFDRRYEDPDQPLTKFSFEALGRATTLEYEGAYAIAPGYEAVFGAQHERTTIDVQTPYYQIVYDELPIRANASLTSGYAQITGSPLSGLTLTGGLRYDDHSTFGDHVTGQAAAAWRLNDGSTVLRASFGQGFKAPSLYELYSPYGNTALRPEEAKGWDAGVEQQVFQGRVVVQAAYFGRVTHNLIDYIPCYGVTAGACAGNVSGGVYDNVGRSEAQGVELQGSWRVIQPLLLSANYSFDVDEDRTPGSPTFGLQLNRRPKNTANLTLDYTWPIKMHTDLAVRYAGDSFDDDADTILLKSYTLVDLRASYPLRDDLELYARVENLADTRYETTYQYGTLGRAGYAGLRFRF